MSVPLLYRRRFVPNELIQLKDDIILSQDNDILITKWVALHPRKDIARGISAYYMDKGYKVSKIYDWNDNVLYWYCDIFQAKTDANKNSICFEDLLIDVILYQNDQVHVMDLDELCAALDLNLITINEVTYALKTLDSLLKIIYQGEFDTLQYHVNNAEKLYFSSSSSNI